MAWAAEAQTVEQYIQSRVPGLSLAMIKLEWADLVDEGLVEPFPSGMTAAPAWERFRLTEYGRQFVDFVLSDESAPKPQGI